MMGSLYVQITTHCNMSCPHCSFGCYAGNPNAEHMSLATYRKALRLAEETEAFLCLGGGEPTIHPDFPRFLLMAMSRKDIEGVFIATNGKVADYAVALARMAGTQKHPQFLDVCLSVDDYHDLVDDRVYDEFEWRGLEMRDVASYPMGVTNQGSARINGLADSDHCACLAPRVTPDGKVFMCGCEESFQLGHLEMPVEELSKSILAAQVLMDHLDVCGRNYKDHGRMMYDAGRVAGSIL